MVWAVAHMEMNSEAAAAVRAEEVMRVAAASSRQLAQAGEVGVVVAAAKVMM